MSVVLCALLASGLILIAGCDPDGKKQCNWVLEPEPKKLGSVGQGFIPVCSRNRVKMKQDCRLQTTLEFAKKMENKKFRYTDLKVKNVGIPRTIESIKLCNDELMIPRGAK